MRSGEGKVWRAIHILSHHFHCYLHVSHNHQCQTNLKAILTSHQSEYRQWEVTKSTYIANPSWNYNQTYLIRWDWLYGSNQLKKFRLKPQFWMMLMNSKIIFSKHQIFVVNSVHFYKIDSVKNNNLSKYPLCSTSICLLLRLGLC